MNHYAYFESPLGELLLTADGRNLTGVHFVNEKHVPVIAPDWQLDPDLTVFDAVRAQLREYFAGGRTAFDLPLAPVGTPFQQSVWRALRAIPYGVTATYGEIARSLGQPTASRAVGAANGRNPISIVVPCHRVIGTDGTLTGYAGGLHRKQALLALELKSGSLFADGASIR
ncbi:MAG: methylated-DNA--[protein]-cysteine S-methyltransferase [Burkholderiales bacterium]|nr:methylated-DNA--[protein]-cysteine S-methyltransferase [Burkholderiales bacterium]